MSTTKVWLTALRWSLVGAAVLGSLGAAVAWWTHVELTSALRLAREADQQRQTAESRLRQVHTEEAELKAKAERFLALQTLGIVGEEQRLAWIDILAKTRASLRIPALDYEILPQRTLAPPMGEGYQFRASSLRLQIAALHEGDLFRFLTALREEAPALIRPATCSLEWARTPDANLAADCVLDWITLATPNAREKSQ